LVCDEIGHGPGGFQTRARRAPGTGSGRLANQATGPQIRQRVDLIDGNQTRDAATAHGHDDLGAILDVLDVGAEAVVKLPDAHLRLQGLGL
jgi:hypothetical protein